MQSGKDLVVAAIPLSSAKNQVLLGGHSTLYNLWSDKEIVIMKSKRIFQIFVLLALVLSPFGSSRSVYASSESSVLQDALVINRDLSYCTLPISIC